MIDERIDYGARWQRFRFPARFQGLRLHESDMTEANRDALLAAEDFAATFGHRHHPSADRSRPDLLGRGLILVGSPGTGKSRIAVAAATEVHYATNLACLYMPVTTYFALGREQQKFVGMAEKLKDTDALAKIWALQRLQDRVMRAPLLILDDLGKEYSAASGWVGTEVHRILRTRFDKGRPSIITTNMPLPEWRKYDGAMYSFIQEAFEHHALLGEDWRRAGR